MYFRSFQLLFASSLHFRFEFLKLELTGLRFPRHLTVSISHITCGLAKNPGRPGKDDRGGMPEGHVGSGGIPKGSPIGERFGGGPREAPKALGVAPEDPPPPAAAARCPMMAAAAAAALAAPAAAALIWKSCIPIRAASIFS